MFGQALEQFETIPLFYIKIFNNMCFFLTNFNITLFFVLISFLFFYLFGLCRETFAIFNLYLIIEKTYRFILNIVVSQTASKGTFYLPIIFCVFVFILFSNIIGLIPGNFCVTSQLFVTLTLSIVVFIGLLILSIQKQGFQFVYFFVPKNVPVILLPFLILIEIISYISRLFSLALRLFANMVAGHALFTYFSRSTGCWFKKSRIVKCFITFFNDYSRCIVIGDC